MELSQLLLASIRRVRADLKNSDPGQTQTTPQQKGRGGGNYVGDVKSHNVGIILNYSDKNFSGGLA